jgi:hypothetical protein
MYRGPVLCFGVTREDDRRVIERQRSDHGVVVFVLRIDLIPVRPQKANLGVELDFGGTDDLGLIDGLMMEHLVRSVRVFEQDAIRGGGHRLRVPEVSGAEGSYHLFESSGVICVPVGEEDPFEVVLDVLPVDAHPFEVALHEGERRSLAFVVVAVDEPEAVLAGCVLRIDQNAISPADIDQGDGEHGHG